jgi:hypothetical protein
MDNGKFQLPLSRQGQKLGRKHVSPESVPPVRNISLLCCVSAARMCNIHCVSIEFTILTDCCKSLVETGIFMTGKTC